MLTVLLICMLLPEMGTASMAPQLPAHGLSINEGAKVSEIRHAKVCQFGSPARLQERRIWNQKDFHHSCANCTDTFPELIQLLGSNRSI